MAGYGICVSGLVLLYCTFCINCAPWEPPKTPICTSYNKLCDVTFDINDNDSKMGAMNYQSGSPICRCPGNSECPSTDKDSAQVVYLQMTSPGLSINAKLSYCDARSLPVRMCGQNELVMTLRGAGPVISEIVGDVRCRCSDPLVLHATRADGIYSLRDYTCGKKVCKVNSSTPPTCEKITNKMSPFGASLESVLPCQCPSDFECSIDPFRIPREDGGTTEFHCEPLRY